MAGEGSDREATKGFDGSGCSALDPIPYHLRPVQSWLVCYQTVTKRGPGLYSERTDPLNVILIGKHPVAWADASRKIGPFGMLTYILFFHSIELNVALMQQNMMSVEDYRNGEADV